MPTGNAAIFAGGDLHSCIRRWSRACDFQFRIALKHDTDRPSSSLSRELGSSNVPPIRGKLAAKTPTNVVLVDSNVGGWYAQRFSHLGWNTRNVLCGNVNEQMVFVRPFGGGAMGLEATMGDH